MTPVREINTIEEMRASVREQRPKIWGAKPPQPTPAAVVAEVEAQTAAEAKAQRAARMEAQKEAAAKLLLQRKIEATLDATLAQRWRPPVMVDGILLDELQVRMDDATSKHRQRIAIIDEEAAAEGITREDLVGRRKLHHIVEARHRAIRRIYALGGISLPQLGKLFGGRDHTTILHVVNGKAEERNARTRTYWANLPKEVRTDLIRKRNARKKEARAAARAERDAA